MHWNSASLTGLVASSKFCCLIASACCLAWKSLYCIPSSISTRSITSASSVLGLGLGLGGFAFLEIVFATLVGRSSLLLPDPLSFRFRSLRAGAISAGGDPVKSTTLDCLVVRAEAATPNECGVADGGGGVKSRYSAKGSESANRNALWIICGRSVGGKGRGIFIACWLLGGRCGGEPGG